METPAGLLLIVVVAAAVVVVIVVSAPAVTAGGGELPGGEGDAAEQLAGILGAAGIVGAFLGGDGVIQHRNDQLSVPLQADDGELAQRDVQPAAVAGQYQLVVEEPPDGRGNLDGTGFAAIADIFDFGTEDHGIQHFHCGHQFDRR